MEPIVDRASSPARDELTVTKPTPFPFTTLAAFAIVIAALGAGATGHHWLAAGAMWLAIAFWLEFNARHRRRNRAIWWACGCIGLIYATMNDRPPSSVGRVYCPNNMRNVAIALLDYAAAHHDQLPRAASQGLDGRPMHSWRALMMPNLGRPDIDRMYHWDKPWDAPENAKVAAIRLDLFICPADPPALTAGHGQTNYCVVTGPGTLFPDDYQVNLANVKDGLRNTILLVESRSGLAWAEPRDLTIDEAIRGINHAGKERCISSFHGRPGTGAYVVFADRHVQFLPDTIAPETLRALLTIDGGEDVDRDDLD